MSAIDSLGGSSNPASASGLSALTSEEFLNIILTELQSQDPLEPQDTEALLSQFSTLYQIESDIKLSDNLGNLVNQNEFTAASLLIGSLVSGVSVDNQRVADIVVSVSNTADGPILNLYDGSRVLFSNVDEVAGAGTIDDGSGDGGTDGADGTDGTDGDGESGGTTPTDSAAAGDSSASDGDAGVVDDTSGDVAARTTHGDRVNQLVQALKEMYE